MRVIPKDKVIFSFNAEHPCQYSVEDGGDLLGGDR